jgi:hypothetical protein
MVMPSIEPTEPAATRSTMPATIDVGFEKSICALEPFSPISHLPGDSGISTPFRVGGRGQEGSEGSVGLGIDPVRNPNESAVELLVG